jgi:hypothetical protein
MLSCLQAVVATNKFEKDMAARFGGGNVDVSGHWLLDMLGAHCSAGSMQPGHLDCLSMACEDPLVSVQITV